MIRNRIFASACLFFVAYILGAITIKYELPPYSLAGNLLDKFSGTRSDLDFEFSGELSMLDELKYPPVKNTEQLHKRINSLLIDLDGFDSAYFNVEILSHDIRRNKLSLVYRYKSMVDTAFAYYKPGLDKNSNIGVNVIPGSGINQSSAMYYQNNVSLNYQSNIDDIAINYGDCYILVKPNEDFLAIHNGKSKLQEVSFVNHLLNNGGSYSAHYLIQSLALSKYIKSSYSELFIFGLSQGGLSAFINSIQSEPDIAVVASGFSILMRSPFMSGYDQLIIPGYALTYSPDNVKEVIGQLKTEFLFTWGAKENGIYRAEATEMMTADFFKELKNVSTIAHPEGHIYHEPSIVNFLNHRN